MLLIQSHGLFGSGEKTSDKFCTAICGHFGATEKTCLTTATPNGFWGVLHTSWLTPFIAGFWAHLAVACKLEQHGFWMEKAVGKTRSQEAGVIGGATVAYSLYQ